jgi:glycosyltransferase involved in cell wall biosynthesis
MSSPGMRARVLFITPCSPSYRASFFDALYRRLAAAGIRLEVLCGKANPALGFHEESMAPAGGERRQVIRFGRRAHWLPGAIGRARASDGTILDEGIAPLHNHAILLLRRLGAVRRVAFWGHGWDFLHGESVKRFGNLRSWERRQVDWWFTYTSLSAAKLADQGFPTERTTVVNNATDVNGLRQALSAVTPDENRQVLARCFGADLAEDDILAVFCSRLSAYKDIEFVLSSANAVHRTLPRFRLIVIGAGERQRTVEAFCRGRPWCAYLGPLHGQTRANYLKRADLWLTGGAVGLEVVDAMGAGIPIVIRESPRHGPEMAYVMPGQNAAVFDGDAQTYAGRIVALLKDSTRLREMRAAAWETGEGLGVEAMAARFAQGVEALLGPLPTATGTGRGR